MKYFASGLLAASLLVGCVDSNRTRLDFADVEGLDAIDTDTDLDGQTAIQHFRTNFESITRGNDSRDRPVDGVATLEWRTTGAARIEVLVDGLPISLDGCIPAGTAGCAAEGSLAVRPGQATRFTLRAIGAGGVCEGACPEQFVDVAVKAPVQASLDYASDTIEPGTDVVLPFTVRNATSYTFGILSNDAEGRPVLIPCGDHASPGDAPCSLELTPESESTTGILRVPAVSSGFTVGVTGTNGATDGLGDLSVGELDFAFGVPVVVYAFTATPAAFLPGDEVVLAWDVAGAQSLSVTTDATSFSGLSTCVGLGVDGRGFCTLTAAASAPLGEARFLLTALQRTGASGEAQATVEIIGGPRIGEFTSSLGRVAPGQPFELAWSAFAADSIAITANPDVLLGLDDCDMLGADGIGRCTVSIAAEAATGDLNLTLTASNVAVGPPAVKSLMVEVDPAPGWTEFGFDDDTRVAGGTAVLRWAAVNASYFLLQSNSGAIAQGNLDSCVENTVQGGGSCTLQLPEGLAPGAIEFAMVAVGPTGARSEPIVAELLIGVAPDIDFAVSPVMLPEGGGQVELDWVVSTATRVVIIDSAPQPATIVDTDVGTDCAAGVPCSPTAGSLMVAVVQPTSFTLTASNDFGEAVATAGVSIEGAPHISELRFAGAAVARGPVAVDGTTGTLVWTVENLDGADQVILQRGSATGIDFNCDSLDANSWTTIAGFPKTGLAAGSAPVGELTATAQCFRFIAEGTETTPPQRDTITFKVYRTPSVASFAAADQTVRLGDVVDLSWQSAFAHRVAVTVAPVGAVTSQDLARCTAASGACAVTIQPGTPLGAVKFSLVASGEASSKTEARDVTVTVGNGARIASFNAQPGALAGAGDVTLSWVTVHGVTVSIREANAEVFASTQPAVVAEGSHTVSAVAATRTWILKVENSFGADSAQVTTFVGASINSLTANGGNALDGEERVVTGPVTVGWSTTSADGFHRLESAPAPANSNCGATGLAWTTRYLKDDMPANSASHADGTVTSNRCYRLTVANTQTPPQSSAAVFLLREVPEVTAISTTPSTLPASGGTVIIDLGVRGATTLAMTAEYRNAAGTVIGTRDVCTQSTLNGGTLTGGATVDSVSCAHRVVACNLLCLNNGVPSDTATIRYRVAVADQEGDAASAATAAGEDVVIP